MHLPRRVAVAAATVGLGLAVAACGGTTPGASGGGDAGGSPAASIAKSVTIKPGDTTPFPLAAGTYRLNWTTVGCTGLTVTLKGDNGYSNEKSSQLPNYSRILTSVPDGNYTISQSDAACTQWTVTLDKVG
jgi:hypothetical protein